MVASHLIWLFRTRGIRHRAKEAGGTFDESEEGVEWQAKGVDLETKFLKLFSKTKSAEASTNAEDDTEDTHINAQHVTPKTVPNAVV